MDIKEGDLVMFKYPHGLFPRDAYELNMVGEVIKKWSDGEVNVDFEKFNKDKYPEIFEEHSSATTHSWTTHKSDLRRPANNVRKIK